MLAEYEADCRWLAQVYESIKLPSGHGKLVWYRLGAKTLDLMYRNATVDETRDDLETVTLDKELIADMLDGKERDERSREIEIRIIERLRRHGGHLRFVAFG